MGLLGAPEVAALSYDPKDRCVYGVRLRQRSRGAFEVVKCASSEHAEWQRAADVVLKSLGVNSSVYLVLGLVPDGCEVFECSMPQASPDIMREALRFEVPRNLMSVPEDFRLQFVPLTPVDENGMVKVRCAVFPESSLHKLINQIAPLRNKPDVMIHPLLALSGNLSEKSVVSLAFMEEGFCWQNGSWQIAGAAECNKELDAELKKLCSSEFSGEYRTCLMCALYGATTLFARNSVLSGVVVLPGFLRPARFRTQLRVMALLIILLAGVNLFRYAGSFMSSYNEQRKLAAKVNNLRSEVLDLRKKLKNGEKQLKELQRTSELKIGSRECMGYLGYLSDKLPDDVFVSNFRWNEGTLDLNLQTSSSDIDLVSFFNRLAGFKVLSASQRTNQMSNITNAYVKLSVLEETPAPPVKKSSSKAKAKK